jgi:hypothetical protein
MNLDTRIGMVLEGYSQTDVGLFTYLLNKRIKITEETVQKILQITPVVLEAEFIQNYDRLTTFDKQFLDKVIDPLNTQLQKSHKTHPTFQDVIALIRNLVQISSPRIQQTFQRNPNRYHDLASYIYRNWENLQLVQDLPEETPEPEEVEETPGIETIGVTSHKPEEEYLA